MPVQAEDFLRFAEALLSKPAQTEIDRRNAAARAYYAVMHLVMPAFGMDPQQRENRHSDVWQQLQALHPATTEPFLREAKKYWRELRETRIKCDYELPARLDLGTASARVAVARKIFDLKT